MSSNITTLFLDIGEVLLTKGWSHESRHLASKEFDYDYNEVEERHKRVFGPYELGKISLEEYLKITVFYKERPFSMAQYEGFMYAQSKAYPEMIELVKGLKEKYNLKVGVVSDEGRELNEFRIQQFQLNEFIDFFISSNFVHMKKPDPEIYQLALDVSLAKPEEVLYLDDIDLFVEVAQMFGINGIIHENYDTTIKKLEKYELTL